MVDHDDCQTVDGANDTNLHQTSDVGSVTM